MIVSLRERGFFIIIVALACWKNYQVHHSIVKLFSTVGNRLNFKFEFTGVLRNILLLP